MDWITPLIAFVSTKSDGFVVHSHSTLFEWRECRDHVADSLGLKPDCWRGGPRELDPERG